MEWIKVEDRKPENGVWVLTFTKAEYLTAQDWHASVMGFEDDRFQSGCYKQPTHWMPLPEPPTNRQRGD